MDFAKTTEQDSHYNNLEQKTIRELLETINNEDQSVPKAVTKVLPQIERLVKKVTEQLQQGGRLFYIGAGTSGRLGILDASECPPTFGVPHDLVIGLIAGGDSAIRKAVEFAEDDEEQGHVRRAGLLFGDLRVRLHVPQHHGRRQDLRHDRLQRLPLLLGCLLRLRGRRQRH